MPPRIIRLFRQPLTSLRNLTQTSSALKRFNTTVAVPKKLTSGRSNSRWLSLIQERIGKCIMFGMSREQARDAAKILEVLGRDWRELVAGRYGYLVDKKRAGLSRHKVVLGDMDCMQHVNNVMYIRYAEIARVNWIRNYANHIDPQNKEKWMQLCKPQNYGITLRTLKTQYVLPMTWPDHISVYHKLRKLPDEAAAKCGYFELDVFIMSESHQKLAARCVEEMMTYDYVRGKRVKLEPWLVDAFKKIWKEQNVAIASSLKKIEEIEGKVRELEVGTWDRADAVEDTGTAKDTKTEKSEASTLFPLSKG